MNDIKKNFNGLNFEVFMGVDGKNVDVEALQQKGEISKNINKVYKEENIDYLNLKVGPLLNNQIAVASSHKKIYQYIRDNKYRKVLILEDDVIPVERNLIYLADTLKQVPEDCELLFLGHILNNDFSLWGKLKYHYLINFLYRIGFRIKPVIRKKKCYPVKYSSLLEKQGAHIGTHAYALFGNGASKLLEIQTPLRHGASDLLLMDAVARKKIQSYTCRYMFFEQNSQLLSSVYNN